MIDNEEIDALNLIQEWFCERWNDLYVEYRLSRNERWLKVLCGDRHILSIAQGPDNHRIEILSLRRNNFYDENFNEQRLSVRTEFDLRTNDAFELMELHINKYLTWARSQPKWPSKNLISYRR